MDCNLPGSSVHGDSLGKNTGVGCHALLQGIFPTQGLNPDFPYCKWILYHLSHQGSPKILEWVVYPFCRGSSQARIELGSPALQVDSLPAELAGKPCGNGIRCQISVSNFVTHLVTFSVKAYESWITFLDMLIISQVLKNLNLKAARYHFTYLCKSICPSLLFLSKYISAKFCGRRVVLLRGFCFHGCFWKMLVWYYQGEIWSKWFLFKYLLRSVETKI